MGSMNTPALAVIDFWSVAKEEIAVTGSASDLSFNDVVVAGIPTGAEIVRVVAMMKFRTIENSYAGVNKLDGNQEIQVRSDAPGTWTDAIRMYDNSFTLAASTREGGDVMIGEQDIKAEVDENDTYEFQWDEAVADEANILLNDVQVGLRIWYRP